MAIEFPAAPTTGNMTVAVPDNFPAAPAGPPEILDASAPSDVNITWEIPAPYNALLGGSFRLRAYAESIGPGQEVQLGATLTVPVVPGQTNYAATIVVPGGTLLGEGENFGGVPVSGVYKIVAVLQHLNGALVTVVSGFAEESIRMFRTP